MRKTDFILKTYIFNDLSVKYIVSECYHMNTFIPNLHFMEWGFRADIHGVQLFLLGFKAGQNI